MERKYKMSFKPWITRYNPPKGLDTKKIPKLIIQYSCKSCQKKFLKTDLTECQFHRIQNCKYCYFNCMECERGLCSKCDAYGCSDCKSILCSECSDFCFCCNTIYCSVCVTTHKCVTDDVY